MPDTTAEYVEYLLAFSSQPPVLAAVEAIELNTIDVKSNPTEVTIIAIKGMLCSLISKIVSVIFYVDIFVTKKNEMCATIFIF